MELTFAVTAAAALFITIMITIVREHRKRGKQSADPAHSSQSPSTQSPIGQLKPISRDDIRKMVHLLDRETWSTNPTPERLVKFAIHFAFSNSTGSPVCQQRRLIIITSSLIRASIEHLLQHQEKDDREREVMRFIDCVAVTIDGLIHSDLLVVVEAGENPLLTWNFIRESRIELTPLPQ